MAYEAKPNTFSLFKDDEDKVAKRKEFYRSKDWDESKVPTYSGKFVLEDGSELNIEARVIEGKKGKFFSGRAWKKQTDTGRTTPALASADLDDDIPF